MLSLSSRDYSFFDEIKTEQYSQVLRLGSDAPYYFGLHLKAAGRESESRAMFELGTRKSPKPFSCLCLRELSRTGSAQERLDAIERILAGGYLLDDKEIEIFENTRSQLLLELRKFGDFPFEITTWFYSRSLTESLVSSIPLLSPDLPSFFLDIHRIRSDVYRKEYQRAWLSAKPLMESDNAEVFQRFVLSDFGKAALYGSTTASEDAAFFERIAERIADAGVQYILAFYAGRLYARSGATFRVKAAQLFENAMKIAKTDEDFDTALWYLLDIRNVDGVDATFKTLLAYAPQWHNSEMFTDILGNLIVSLVKARDWKAIVVLRNALVGIADGETQVRLDYLAARSGTLSATETNVLYLRAFNNADGAFYYRILSAAALDIPFSSANAVWTSRSSAENAVGENAAAEEEEALVLRGFIRYKLPRMVYPVILENYPTMVFSLAVELNKALMDEGMGADAIKVINFSLRSGNTFVTDEVLAFLYPRPWLSEVSEASARFGVPEYLLYALMRSESYFQRDAISSVGAQGLTQLMNSTAGDIARKLKVDSFDLLDPKTNIPFGAFYLNELIGRLDKRVLPALFAYNAGISRVRDWLKTASLLSDDLFLETLPYTETREYGRKVLAAAAIYGYLYYQKTTGQIVREIF